MYFKIIKTFIVVTAVVLSGLNAFADDVFYAKIIHIDSEDNSPPVLKLDGTDKSIKTGDTINENETLLTLDNQEAEMILYRNDKPAGAFLLMENSDFRFSHAGDVLNITMIYGGMRVVSGKGLNIAVTSRTVEVSSNGADFCLISAGNADNNRTGYAAVFDGNVHLTSLGDASNSFDAGKLQKCDFLDYKVYPPASIEVNASAGWTADMLFRSKNLPDNLAFALEGYYAGQTEEGKIPVNEQVPPQFKKTKSVPPAYSIAGMFLKFEFGEIFHDNNGANFAVKLVYMPGGIIQDKYEFGFYFPFDLVISKITTNERFLKVNRGNNEWSFGTDQGGNIGAIIFDIMDDFLLKHRVFRYNNPDDMIYLKAGDNFDVSDYLQYSLMDFNSFAFYPFLRKHSLVNTYNLGWFEAMIYAEDTMPKGLYGADVSFMTPNKSNKLRFRLSSFIDCYDLIKFENTEAFFPMQFNTTLAYDVFNVPSLKFSMFASYGMYLPLSNNYYDNRSSFAACAGKNPAAIASNMSGDLGLDLRMGDFKFGIETIFDSGLNKVGLFDSIYIATRENRWNVMNDWLDELSRRSVNIYDYNFGFRLKVGYSFLNNFFVESRYQLTFPKYYDKFYLKIGYDSREKFLVNFNVYFMFETQQIVYDFTSLENFQLNTVAYIGGGFSPASGIYLNFRGGIYPEFTDTHPPLYSKFMLDCYVSLDFEKILKKYYQDKEKNATNEMKK